jgi:hypothetical protein
MSKIKLLTAAITAAALSGALGLSHAQITDSTTPPSSSEMTPSKPGRVDASTNEPSPSNPKAGSTTAMPSANGAAMPNPKVNSSTDPSFKSAPKTSSVTRQSRMKNRPKNAAVTANAPINTSTDPSYESPPNRSTGTRQSRLKGNAQSSTDAAMAPNAPVNSSTDSSTMK